MTPSAPLEGDENNPSAGLASAQSFKKKWAFELRKHPEWLVFDRKDNEITPGALPFSIGIDPGSFSRFLNESDISKTLEQSPQDVRITMPEQSRSKVIFEGQGKDGRSVSRDRLLTLINDALTSKNRGGYSSRRYSSQNRDRSSSPRIGNS